jgi:hypothetical protein
VASLDVANWSGEGTFTQQLIDRLQMLESITLIRVEDAPASRAEANYNLISNEIFVAFATRMDYQRRWRYGFLPMTSRVTAKAMTVADLERALADVPDIGPPDYADEGMLQYLKTERIIPPYQTRGFKIVELVRVYEVGTPSRGNSH